jgi:hypothetical protein
MNCKGVEFTLLLIEPGVWKWRFQIGGTVSTGKAQTSLMGMAAHRVHVRIDRELKKAALSGYSLGPFCARLLDRNAACQ